MSENEPNIFQWETRPINGGTVTQRNAYAKKNKAYFILV
jgi:hypothetical protein